jgi:hypothetical protein
MSRPVADSELVAPDLHHAVGIWKLPTKIPVSAPVSINVKPVAPKPASIPEARPQEWAAVQRSS